MKKIENLEIVKNSNVGVVIGNFDGVHLGHQKLIKEVLKDCKKEELELLLITFRPHPKQTLKALKKFLINSYDERAELLDSCGMFYFYEIPFTRDLSMLPPKDFLDKYILPLKNIKKIFLGHDFSFGVNKTGNHDFVREYFSNSKDVDVIVLNKYELNETLVSSSKVRESLSSGRVEDARMLLGREYFITGRVIRGIGRGKKIGFPTANIDFLENILIPQNGVYSTKVRYKDKIYDSITNVGVNPTFNDVKHIGIETHILNFDQDIYGENLRVYFDHKIRDEKKFNSVEELVFQIKMDIEMRKK